MARAISIYLLFSVLLLAIPLQAVTTEQDSTLLTKNFKFRDGIYMDFSSFTRNTPWVDWDATNTDMVTSWDKKTLQVAAIQIRGGNSEKDSLDLSKVWGLCLNGIPYIRLGDSLRRNNAWVFASLQVRGRLSYFEYEEAVTELLTMKAYNPLTGKAFREGQVPQKKVVTQKMMLHFETGELLPFNKDNFMTWIREDKGLVQAVSEIDPADHNKLYKSLLIYDDRNPVYLP